MTRSSAMRRIIVSAMLLGLCACGGGDDPAATSAGTSGATAKDSPAADSPAADSSAADSQAADSPAAESPAAGPSTEDAPAVGSETAANLPKQLCQFLKQEVPRLKARGSSVGALAGFAVDYAGWVEKDPNRRLSNAQELDAIATATCPKVRKDVLAVLDTASFSAVLGS